jgi:phenylpropionate dioxygenase-like ring-hydroxylating dioxygenase large terminal subunit
MCRYHGWNYDETGYAFGIPKRSEYNLGDVARECLSLKAYRVETCGQFVFVSTADCPLNLREFLGSFWDMLGMLSRHIGTEYHFTDIPHRANWKLLVENVLDNYHCATLHRESFLGDGFCLTPPEDVVIGGPHSSFHVPRTPTADEKHESLRRRLRSHLSAREFAHDSYFHIFIFPNLFIASTEGTTFFIGQALPVAPDSTQLRVRYLEPAMELAPRHRAKQDMVNKVTSENGLRIIIEEDLPVLETVQQGLSITDLPGFIGEGEVRIRAWRGAYNSAMSEGLPAVLAGSEAQQVA